MKKRSRVNRYNIGEFIHEYPCYEMPRVFFEAEYKGLSSDAKMAYAVLRDKIRTGSEKGWLNDGDEIDEIYIKCDIDRDIKCELERIGNDVAKEIRISKSAALRAMKQLIDFNLVKLGT